MGLARRRKGPIDMPRTPRYNYGSPLCSSLAACSCTSNLLVIRRHFVKARVVAVVLVVVLVEEGRGGGDI